MEILLNTTWWAEVKAVTEPIDWRSSQQIDADRYAEYQGFLDDLNRKNPPPQIRIVTDPD
jgi:hypothetical protein